MGRKALLAVISWLTLSVTSGDKGPAQSSAVDNESAESAPRLYRNAPLGVYASAAPYGAYSFHMPTFISAPFAAASQPVPVKQEALVISHNNGFLRDSYGNRFVATPQTLGYKTAFPPQFVPLQKLPEHLAQPLVGASANFQFKETAPQVFVGSPYRIATLQGPSSTPVGQYPGFSQPLVYADKIKSLAPASGIQKALNAQQQSTNNKAFFVNKQANDYYGHEPKYQRIQEIYGEPTFQRIQEIPQLPNGETKFQRLQESSSRFPAEYKYVRYGEPQQREKKVAHADSATLQAVPAKKTVTYVNNLDGKTTVVNLETLPPVPLLDLTLLEPLTFENPLVPQVQHFLPRIHQATYQKLPQELFKTKTQKKPSEPTKKIHHKITPKKTTVTHHETLDEAPEIAYEINQPNYKETYSEKAVSYNKETTSPPVTITYGSKIENEPVTYSYSRSSDDTPQSQEIRSDNDEPSPLVYHINPEEQNKNNEDIENHSSEDESESLREAPQQSDGINHHYHELAEEYTERPQSNQYHEPSHDGHYQQHSAESNEKPKSEHSEPRNEGSYHQDSDEFKENPKSNQQKQQQHDDSHNQHPKDYKDSPKSHYQHEPRNDGHYHQHVEEYKENPHSNHYHEPRHSAQYHRNTKEYKETPQYSPHLELQHDGPYRQNTGDYKDSPKSNHHEPQQVDQKHQHKSSLESQSDLKSNPQKFYSQPTQITAQNYEVLNPVTQEYEEDIRLLPTPSAIKVDPNQHVQYTKSTAQPYSSQSAPPHHDDRSSPRHNTYSSSDAQPPRSNSYSGPQSERHEAPASHYSAAQSDHNQAPEPHIHEKSKRIIIKEETPESMHMLTEKMRKETIQREENSEEDFEKAYKDAALGFPAYSQVSKEAEKSIFDPASYGVPPEHIEYDIEHVPFQQYQEEGDEFPKTVRLNYKDARDKTKDDYYTGYKSSTPERLNDRYRNKDDYYKVYRNNKPDYLERDKGSDNKKQHHKSEKYTAAPSHEYPPQKAKSYYVSYKPKQQLYEYDYSRGPPRDNSAFASIPLHNYRLKTNFVEPQYQYGFEPVSIPKLLDSELAAMASNHSPESEKPGMRKKIYKENWYIKQTSMSAGDPAS